MPARSFRFNNNTQSDNLAPNNADVDAVIPSSLEPPVIKAATVTPPKSLKPSRIRKQTEHYNPLEENKKPQHQTSSPNRKKKNLENAPQVPKRVERKEETPLILKPVSNELLCEHCNFGGDLMQCHHAGSIEAGGGKKHYSACDGIGCAKVVHPFCVGRETIPEGGWICTACSIQHGYKVKIPKELRNHHKDITLDYGYAFTSDETEADREYYTYQQMEQELMEWGGKIKITPVGEPTLLPHNLFGSFGSDEETEDDDADSCAHSVGPCDVCKVDGELLRCHSQLTGIGCGKGVHMYCVFRDEMPEGDWVCEDCASDNNLKLDKKYPAMGYEYPVSDIKPIPKGEDTFEWNEVVGNRMQVGSRIGVYDEEDDEYKYGTVEHKDVSATTVHISFDDGGIRPVYMWKRRIRMLSEYHPNLDKLRMRMRMSLDPSLPNYIICGGGVTKAHDRKHAHRLLEHYVDVVLDDDVKYCRRSESDSWVQKVLEKLKDDDVEFIQWDATIGGFGKASKKEIKKKILSTFKEKLEERVQLPQAQAQPPMIPLDDGPIQHVLLVNGVQTLPEISRKQASDDPVLAVAGLQEKRRRYRAREYGVISMYGSGDDMSNESALAESASALIQLGQKEVVHHSAWNDATEEKRQQTQKGQQRKDTLTAVQVKNGTIPYPQTGPVSTNRKRGKKREETISEFLAKSRGKLVPATRSVPTAKKRGRSPKSAKASLKKSKKEPPPKKRKSSPKTAPNTNSANREIALCQRNSDKWYISLQRAAQFRKKHGHCNIPSSYEADPKLATWAKRQRHQYQLYLRKDEKCTMTPERIKALGDLGFSFDHQQIKWLQKFEELKEYIKENGHCRVSATKKGEQKLGAWVKHQKAQKKLYDEGLPSFITKNRVDMLESIGFVWRFR